MQGAWKILSWAAGKGEDEEGSKFTLGSDFTSPVKQSWIPGVEGEEEFEGIPELEVTGGSSNRRSSTGGGPSSRRDDAGNDSPSLSSIPMAVEEPEDPLVQRFRKFLSEAEAEAAVGAPPSPSYGNSTNSVRIHMMSPN